MKSLLVSLLLAAGLAGCGAGAARNHVRHGAAVALPGTPTETVAPASAPSGALHCRLRLRRYRTLPSVKPVGLCLVRRRGARLADDDILVTPRPDPKKNPGEQFGLMILSPRGKLLWYRSRPQKVHDLKMVTYRGAPALAYFQQAPGGGYYQLLDQAYRPIGRVRTGHGYPTNLHELELTPGGTAWVSADVPTRVGGAKVTEFVVQEVDVATGRVLFEWHSTRDVAPADSYEERPARPEAWDYFHGNALSAPAAPGDVVVVSSRNTSSLYGVDPASGRIRWIFGGKRDQFGLAAHPSWRFCAQHDAHRLPNGELVLFDNGGTYMHGTPKCPVHAARAMIFRLDVAHHTARLVRAISSRTVTASGKGYFPGYVGSAREESNGDVLIDWGPDNRISEISPSGRQDLLLRVQRWSYRAAPAAWVGHPGGRPAIAVQRRAGGVDVWASWNGATAIARWQVLAGPSAGALAPVGRPVAFADLETHMVAATAGPFVAVRAVGADGGALGQSRAARVH